jgi:hypothetical protein
MHKSFKFADGPGITANVQVLLQVEDFLPVCPVLLPGFVLLMNLRNFTGLYWLSGLPQ